MTAANLPDTYARPALKPAETAARSIRVVFCWPCPSGYMAACFRELSRRAGVRLSVLGFEAARHAAFSKDLVADLDCELMPVERRTFDYVEDWVTQHQPDVIVQPGWGTTFYRKLAFSRKLRDVPFVMGMDSPGHGWVRQQGVRLFLARFLSRMRIVVVTGERAWRYARTLGVAESRLRRGLYGIDYDAVSRADSLRRAGHGGWPRRFLYIGRYAPEKAIDVLVRAYRTYRDRVRDPWPLTCCGSGPSAELLEGVEGLENRGFIQPGELPALQAEHGAFLLPSRFDPWPLVVVEACAAGLPVICTEACGSAVEHVRPYYNGLTVPTDDASAFAAAMEWAHRHADDLPEMGRNAQQFARAYAAPVWAGRWEQYLRQAVGA